ncbi:extensin family protein [Methylobacterium mesophilicum SR1.6/6]|uniref:Extensin family protein n=1 Tax=Methylobacterium mesophilicum SR1.6/6 TaxID=908290 RepID=A0A6B9F8K7_9HYPH|nr:extensin family protein [Methylobacterium mesophilicum]QGY00531.1 extensin family protein [Methylobacterium mesophilicum SR1.6/6]
MPGRLPPIRRTAPPLARSLLVLGLAIFPAASGRTAEAPAATVPVPPPKPPERPDALKPPAAPETALPAPPARPAELTPPTTVSPKESGKPAVEAGTEAGKPEMPSPPPTPPGRPPELSGEAALALKVSPPDDTACRTRLKRLGVEFEPLPPIAEGQCTAPLPLKVTKFADGVTLPQGATLTCRSAEALARWVTEVQVEAERTLKHPLATLELGGSYVCRGQNHDFDAKLSEHAFANAADVMGFSFAGRPSIPVKAMPEGSEEARFLVAVRGKACEFFRTVLGPGTNAAHSNHFHLDERERNAGHRLCE